jgi:hypothetical protein
MIATVSAQFSKNALGDDSGKRVHRQGGDARLLIEYGLGLIASSHA